jgi:hypothetical protein
VAKEGRGRKSDAEKEEGVGNGSDHLHREDQALSLLSTTLSIVQLTPCHLLHRLLTTRRSSSPFDLACTIVDIVKCFQIGSMITRLKSLGPRASGQDLEWTLQEVEVRQIANLPFKQTLMALTSKAAWPNGKASDYDSLIIR